MVPWYLPLKSPFFLTGVIINAMLAFFLLWTVRNRGSRVWFPIFIAMIGVGTIQAIFVLASLCLSKPPAPLIVANIPLAEFEPVNDSSSDEDNNNEQ